MPCTVRIGNYKPSSPKANKAEYGRYMSKRKERTANHIGYKK